MVGNCSNISSTNINIVMQNLWYIFLKTFKIFMAVTVNIIYYVLVCHFKILSNITY